MLDILNIVRDCWWAMPSGNIYPVDENGYLSSHTHGLYKSLNANDAEYIQDNGSGNFTYYGRLSSTNINVDAVYVTLRAESTPAASAVLYINNDEIGSFDIDSKATQDQNFILNSEQQNSIHYGRIDSNYDYFAIKLTGETESKLYNLDIAYSGSSTWDNHETGLPNVITGTFLPTKFESLYESTWSGSVDNINQYVVESGADNSYITHNNAGGYYDYWSGSCLTPSGGLVLHFNDFGSSVNTDIFYDDRGLFPGSGIGITQSNLTDITPSGMGGYAVLTQGGNSYINFGNIYNIGLNDATLMCWIRNSGVITASTIGVGKTDISTADHKYYIGLATGGYPRLYFRYDTGDTHIINGSSAINDNEWHHIAFVLDRDNRMELFCDGQSCGSDSASAYSSIDNQSDVDFGIGWGDGYSNNQGEVYVDDTRIYLQALNSGEIMAIASGISINKTPNSQWTFDRQITPTIDPLTQITRAKLNLRMALPPSGDYENARDTFEINGYNHRYKNQDNKEDLTYIDTTKIVDQNGYLTYGAGDIVEADTFTTYSTELNFIDPTIPSGSYASTINRNIDILSNMEFRIIGLPSGTQLSSADLQVEYIPNDCLSLYTTGGAHRCAASSTVDIGITNIHSCGNGGWHHQGYRSYGPTTIEEEIFTNFYTFSESSGYKTYPKSVYTSYFAGNADDTAYGYSLGEVPSRIFVGQSFAPFAREPLRREYYRNPITAEDLTPSWYSENRDITNISPSYYRNMIYHGESLQYLDVEMSDGDVSSLNTDSVYSIYFEDRIDLTEDFTLYFMLYRHNGLESYGRFFTRSLPRAYGTDEYEIIGDIEPNLVRFTVKDDGGYENEIEVEIDQYTKEPILIWFTCGYEERYAGMTTMSLNVHDDVGNYFSVPWKTSTEYFTGHRKMYSSSLIEHLPTRVEYYGPITVLGTVENLTFTEQLSRRLYLHRISYCEFGYENEYMDLDPDTNLGANQAYYDMSIANDKRFLSSRLATNLYLQLNPSGINWLVPYGSGEAEWTSSYNIDNWIAGDIKHSLFNPVSTAGTNNLVAPSAIYIDLESTHHTDHPSGVQVFVDVNFDNGSDEHCKVAHLEFNIPSGTSTYRECIDKHINMYGGPILYSSLENIDLDVTTKYINIGSTQYYGDFTINSIHTYFDSYCIPASSGTDLDLYTYGSFISFPSDPDDASLDLYAEGCITVTGNTDLYTYGDPHIGSGILELYTKAEQAPLPPVGDPDSTKMNLFIEGLDPPDASGILLLYTWATASGVSGFNNKMTLYTKSDLDPDHRLPLYLLGEAGEINSNMNLFLCNIPLTENNSLDLFIPGPSGIKGLQPYGKDLLIIGGDYYLQLPDGSILYLGETYTPPNVTNLYIQGLGTTEGYKPCNTDMPLFMARDSEAVAGRLSLFMQAKTAEELPLYIQGSVTEYNYGGTDTTYGAMTGCTLDTNSEINFGTDDFCLDLFFKVDTNIIKNRSGTTFTILTLTDLASVFSLILGSDTKHFDIEFGTVSDTTDTNIYMTNNWNYLYLEFTRSSNLLVYLNNVLIKTIDISSYSSDIATKDIRYYTTYIPQSLAGVCIGSANFLSSDDRIERYNNGKGRKWDQLSTPLQDKYTNFWNLDEERVLGLVPDQVTNNDLSGKNGTKTNYPGPQYGNPFTMYIHGSGGPVTQTLDFYTHGF